MIDKKIKLLADNLYKFIKNKRNIQRDPQIKYKFDDSNAKKILGKTGHYDPNNEEIVIYCSNRHPKDILRSLAHELFHHVQNLEGRMNSDEMGNASDENYILHNNFLRDIEEEAFREGNLDLREWEAHMKENKQDPVLNETKLKTSDKKRNTKVNENLTPIVTPEVVTINDALKDSVVYNPDDRACNDLYNGRDELVYQELLKKFGIKK